MNHRKWWIAALLTIPLPGLGHLYCGKTTTAIVFMCLTLFVQVAPAYLFIFHEVTILTLLLIPLFLIYAIVHSIVTAIRIKDHYAPKKYSAWYFYLLIWAVVIFGIFIPASVFFKAHFAQAYHMPSKSMEPTLLKGDFLFAIKNAYRKKIPERYDIIVFKYPRDGKTDYIKRVIALPGEVIEITGSSVFVNGEALDISFMSFEKPFSGIADMHFGPKTVPKGHIFVLGDSFYNSSDSREWGPLSLDKVTGKLAVIYYSIDYDNNMLRPERIGKRFH